MPRTTDNFELVINGDVCKVEITKPIQRNPPVYGVVFRDERVGTVTRLKQNKWEAHHKRTDQKFLGHVRVTCVTAMIMSIYKE